MAEGFKIAEGFVEVKADSAGLREEVSRDVEEAGLGQAIKVKLKLDEKDTQGLQGKAFGGGLLSNLAPFILPAVSAVGLLSGAMAVGVPIALGLGTALAAAKVGFSGFADALKTGHTPAQLKKANQALAELSPQARQTALAVRGLKPAFDSIKTTTQNALFQGLAQTVRQMGVSDLPVVKAGLSGMAGGINDSIRQFGLFATSTQTVLDLGAFLNNATSAGHNLSGAVRPIFSILRDIGTVASSFLPALALHFAQAAQRAADFIAHARDTGKLHEWIQTGLDAFKQLWQVVKNLLGIIIDLAKQPGFGHMLLDSLVQVTGFVLKLLNDFPQLVPIITSVVAAIKLWRIAQLALNLVTNANPWMAVLAAVILVVTLIVTHWTQVKDFLAGVWNWIKSTATTIWNSIKDFFVGILVSIVTWAITTWTQIRDFFTATWNGIKDFFVGIWNGIKSFFIGIMVAIVSAVLAYLTQVRSIFVSIWNAIASWVQGAVDRIRGIINWFANLPGMIGNWFSGVYNAIVDWFGRAVDWIRGVPGRILSALGNLGSLLVGVGRDIVNGLWNGIRAGWDWLTGAVSSLAGSLLNAAKSALGIGSPSKVFAEGVGHWIPAGIAQGIEHNTGAATDATRRLAQHVVGSASMVLPGGGSASVSGSLTDTAGGISIANLTLQISGNLDPTNPVAWRQAIENIRQGIRSVERSYA